MSSRTEGPDPHDRDVVDGASPAAPSDDAPGGAEPASGSAPSGPQHDPARRAFFFQFGKQAVTAVGQVAGMADIVGRTSSGAAASLLGLAEPTATRTPPVVRSGGTRSPAQSTAKPAADDSFRSPYRITADELVLLDQRGIPESLDEVVARRGSDVAYYMRIGVVRGGALLAQVAAYGVALTAQERSGQPPESRDIELRRTRRALVSARVSSRLPVWAMDQMEAVSARLGDGADGVELAAALRAEADAIATGFQSHHAAIVAELAELLPTPAGRPLAVLVHGDPGMLSSGLVGTGLSALRRVRDQGQPLRLFLTEGRPFMDGARLASWELRQAGIEHQVIPDAAVAWLFEREPIDAVLIGAEWVAANGDTGALLGSRAVAQQAGAATPGPDGGRPRVIVCGVSAAISPATPDGAAIPVELRPARDMAAYLADVPIRASDALVPASDVMAAVSIDVLVTERGVAAPPAPEAIATLLATGAGEA